MTKSRISLPTAFVVGITLALSFSTHAAPPCNADLDDDGAVGVKDLLNLLALGGRARTVQLILMGTAVSA